MSVMGLVVCLLARSQEPGIEYLGPDDSTGTSKAVVVGGQALAHTAQLLPLDASGEIVGRGDLDRQIQAVLAALRRALGEVGSDLERAVRIHVYLARPEGVEGVRKAFARLFGGRAKPAATFVVGTLAHPAALVAMDAVAIAPRVESVRRARAAELPGEAGASHVAVLPAGPAVFVSGQASSGELGPATRKTLESLRETLKEFGMKDEHVVQLKAFLKPMSDQRTVWNEISSFYGGRNLPPVVFVEWTLDPPVEIELVASGTPQGEGKEALRFLTPAGVKPSPVYSRVARVDRGRLIFVSGLGGTGDARSQVRGTFEALRGILEEAGGDFRHLVKATYYVTDAPTTEALGKFRLELYDPERPPAASKAQVRGVGAPERTLELDMIGVIRP